MILLIKHFFKTLQRVPGLLTSVKAPSGHHLGEMLVQKDAERVLTEAEIDRHIEDCGLLLVAVHGIGNRAEAEGWLRCQTHAIAARKPTHKARLEAEIMARINA